MTFPTPKQFIPKNPNKYKGSINNIIYRSSWELRLFQWADMNDKVLLWSSEEIVIPYKSPKDGKIHRYFPDLYLKYIDSNNNIKECLIEIKPRSQTQLRCIKRKSKKYIKEEMTYAINVCKWEAAKRYCKARGIIWLLISEGDTGFF